MRWQKVRLCCLALVRATPGAVILRLRRLVSLIVFGEADPPSSLGALGWNARCPLARRSDAKAAQRVADFIRRRLGLL